MTNWKDPPFYSWVNPLFQWPCSIAKIVSLPGRVSLAFLLESGSEVDQDMYLEPGVGLERVYLLTRVCLKIVYP